MSQNVYQQFIEAQKTMFEEWNKSMAPFFKQSQNFMEPFCNPTAFHEKMQEAPNEFWKKAGEGYKAYQAVFELWKKLSEKEGGFDAKAANELYEAWTKQYFGYIRNNLSPELPPFVQDYAKKFADSMENAHMFWGDQAKTWAKNAQNLQKSWLDAMVNGPKGYLDFLNEWQKAYDESFGKLMNAPTFGKDMAYWKQQKEGFDTFIKYNIAATKFSVGIHEIAQDATKQVMEDYVNMFAEGTQPKTFEEFYKYWSKAVSNAYQKFLFSEEMSTLAGNMVNAMSRFKIAYDKVCESWLAQFPVVKKSDVDDLYKDVYELKKEVRALKKQLQAKKDNKGAAK